MNSDGGELTEVRLDRWLWAARFFKTRQLATEAVRAGHVEINNTRPKPARSVRIGDHLNIRRGPFVYRVRVEGLAERRGSAQQAHSLYTETAESVAARARLADQLRTEAQQILYDPGRPQPRDRRAMRQIKRGSR